MNPKRIAIAWLVSLASISTLSSGGDRSPRPAPPVPRPEWTPGQVVEFQLEALQFNDRPTKDAGIATTFQFASPENRKITGPLAHFAEIVKAPGYRTLINHRVAGYGKLIVQGDLAIRQVTVVAADGEAFDYEFRLSKDPESRCWFTDGVVPIPKESPIEPGKLVSNP